MRFGVFWINRKQGMIRSTPTRLNERVLFCPIAACCRDSGKLFDKFKTCGCGQNGKGGWLRTSRLGVRISPPAPCDCTQTGKAAKLKPSCLQVRSLSVAPNSESWVSGLNHLTANEAHRKVPRVRISHSPPEWKRCSTVGRWS